MKKTTIFFALIAVAIIMTMSSCQQTCYMTQPNGMITSYQATTCPPQTTGYNTGGYTGGYTGGNGGNGNGTGGNGINAITDPSAFPIASMTFIVQDASLQSKASAPQFYQVTPDLDQNYRADPDRYGSAVNPNYISLSGYAYNGISYFRTTLICDAGMASSLYSQQVTSGQYPVVNCILSNVPYGYSCSISSVTLQTDLSTKANAIGIYAKMQ